MTYRFLNRVFVHYANWRFQARMLFEHRKLGWEEIWWNRIGLGKVDWLAVGIKEVASRYRSYKDWQVRKYNCSLIIRKQIVRWQQLSRMKNDSYLSITKNGKCKTQQANIQEQHHHLALMESHLQRTTEIASMLRWMHDDQCPGFESQQDIILALVQRGSNRDHCKLKSW